LLVDFEPIGGRAVELVAGVLFTDLSHKADQRLQLCSYYRKWKKEPGKGGRLPDHFLSSDWGIY
jgi:hypothetical protein